MQFILLLLVAIIGMLVLLNNVQAFDYSTISHKLSRGALKRNPKYFAPVVHPFSDDKALMKENDIDALGGFLLKNSRSTMEGSEDLYTLGSLKKVTHPNTNHRQRSIMNKMEQFGISVEDNVDYEHPVTKSQTKYKYKSIMHRGTVNIEIEDDVSQVVCPQKQSFVRAEEERILKITFKNTPLGKQKMNQWVPGTRLVVPSKYACGTQESNERGESAFYLMVRRTSVEKTSESITVTYTTKVQRIEQMFVKSSIDFQYIPASTKVENIEEAMFSDKAEEKLMDLAANAKSNIPKPFEKNRRQSINTLRTFDLLNFNYNKNTKQAEKQIDFYKSSTTTISCTNCFAYLTFKVHFQMVTTFWHIDVLKLTVGGSAGARMSTLLDFQYGYHEEFTKHIFSKTLPTISFAVGVIPVRIAPSVSLSGVLKVDADAKLIVTHDAYYYDSLTLGVEWNRDYSRFDKINKRATPKWTIEAPKIDKTSQAVAEVRVTMKPKLTMSFYHIAPVNLEFLPYIGLNAQVAGGGCGSVSASYSTYWGLQMSIQMLPLQIPSSISVIGGTTFDFGGKLPYPKYGNSIFTMVGKTKLNCYYCSGCASLYNKVRSLGAPAPTSFAENLLSTPRAISDTNELALGKDFELSLEANECKTYQTTSQFLPSNMKYNGVDSRAIAMTLTPKGNPLKIKIGESSANSDVETATADAIFSKRFNYNKLTINICNEASEKVSFSMTTRPYAKLSYGIDSQSTVDLSLPKATAAQLEFVDVKREAYREFSNKNFIRVSKQATEGDFIMMGTVYSNSEAITDRRSLSSPIASNQRVNMDLKFLPTSLESHNHAENDFNLLLSVMGSTTNDNNNVKLSVENFLFIENTDREYDVSNIGGIEVDVSGKNFISQLIAKPTPTHKSFCVVLEQKVKGITSQCFNDITDSEFSRVFDVESRIVEIYNMKLSKLTYKFSQLASSASYEDMRVNSKVSQMYTQSTSSITPDFDEIIATIFKDTEGEMKITIEGFELTNNANLDQRFSSPIHSEEHSIQESKSMFTLNVAKLNNQYGKNLQFRFKLSTSSNQDIIGKFIFHEVTTVNSINEISGGIQTKFDEEMHVYKLSPSFLSKMNNHIFMTVEADEGNPEILLSEDVLPSNYERDILSRHSTTEKSVTLGYATIPGKTYYIGISTADSDKIMNYKMQLKEIDPSNVEFSVVSNPTKKTITDADIREHGLKLTFDIKSSPHQWSPLMTNIDSNRAAELYNMFIAGGQWKEILENFESLRQRALNPSDPFRYDSFIQLTPIENPTTLTVNMPPLQEFYILTPIDVTVSSEGKTLPAEFFNTHFSNALTGDYSFSIQPAETINYYFAIAIVAIVAFVCVVVGFGSFLAILLARAFCKVPSKLKKNKLTTPEPAAEHEEDNKNLLENDSLETQV